MPALHFKRALTSEGWASNVRIRIDGATIASVERDVPHEAGDERCGIGVPAIGNLHSHAFQRALAGLTEKRGEAVDSFWTWRDTMYRFALAVTPDDVEAIAAQAYVEMLEAGYGAVAEFHYLHHDRSGARYANRAEMAERIGAAATDTGIGLSLLPVFYARSGFGGAPALQEQRRFVNDLESYATLVADCRSVLAGAVRVGVAPHSLRAATPHELAGVAAIAGGAPIHIHIAEQTGEVDACLAWSGARPVHWLFDHAEVDARWCLVHATHIDEDEVLALARSGAVAGLCPITEANLGDGVFPAGAFLDAAGRFGVGTDSNVEITVAGELRMLEYSQRLTERARNVCARRGGSTGAALFAAAAAGGAQALDRPGGTLGPGAAADIVSLNGDSPLIAGRADDEILDAWVFGGARDLVDGVWSGGRKVVSDGRHMRRETIAVRFGETLRRLAAAVGA
jgi:formimidoylglutamate deiminase